MDRRLSVADARHVWPHRRRVRHLCPARSGVGVGYGLLRGGRDWADDRALVCAATIRVAVAGAHGRGVLPVAVRVQQPKPLPAALVGDHLRLAECVGVVGRGQDALQWPMMPGIGQRCCSGR